MFDYEVILRRALENVRDEPIALATVYDLPQRVCHDLAKQRHITLIVDSVEHAQLESWCAGWWIDRERDQIYVRPGVAPTILIAGVDRASRVGTRLLLEARLKGTRRIVTSDRDGDLVEDLQVEPVLLERIAGTELSRLTGPTYEDAFSDMYELVGDKLKIESQSFNTNRTLMFVGSLGPGGAERQCANTAVGILEDGTWEPIIACDHFEPPADFHRSYVERSGLKVVEVDRDPPELSDPFFVSIEKLLAKKYAALNVNNLFVQIVQYAALIRKLRPALVHTWMDYCNTLAGTAAVMSGVPSLVLSCRSVAPNHFRIFQPYMRPGYRELLRRQDALILNNSRAGGMDYAHWLGVPDDRVRVIHNGFQFPEAVPQHVKREVRKRYAIPESASVVGSILRFSEEKQPRVLIDMARELNAADGSLHFLYFGDGVLLQEMRDYVASLDLAHVIHLPGVTDKVWEGLAAMDLFVLASRVEGLPNVLIEAQASGVPVVCSRVGGASETFTEGLTGVSVEEVTPSAFAATVRRILGDSHLRMKMSRRASSHARKEFGLQPMIQRTMQAYRAAAREE